MKTEDVRQRIQYLVQHGGIYADPLADLYAKTDRLTWIVSIALSINLVILVRSLL